MGYTCTVVGREARGSYQSNRLIFVVVVLGIGLNRGWPPWRGKWRLADVGKVPAYWVPSEYSHLNEPLEPQMPSFSGRARRDLQGTAKPLQGSS